MVGLTNLTIPTDPNISVTNQFDYSNRSEYLLDQLI